VEDSQKASGAKRKEWGKDQIVIPERGQGRCSHAVQVTSREIDGKHGDLQEWIWEQICMGKIYCLF
jgi:hypothetical protein